MTIANTFISSIDNREESVMHSKSDDIEIMIDGETDELFDSLKNRYMIINWNQQKVLSFSVSLSIVWYKCHEINPNYGGSYVDNPDWIKIKKTTINPINKKDIKCFQYAIAVC